MESFTKKLNLQKAEHCSQYINEFNANAMKFRILEDVSGISEDVCQMNDEEDVVDNLDGATYSSNENFIGQDCAFPNVSPKDLVDQLNEYVIGQDEAKKIVAIAFRNRYRRSKINDKEMREAIGPSNVLMIGPTGVGKTAIGKRIAHIAHAPFVRTEATKFTEVGYVGKDVEQIIKDLVDVAILDEKERQKKFVHESAKDAVAKQIASILVPDSSSAATHERFLKKIQSNEMEETEIEIDVPETKDHGPIDISSGLNMLSINDIIGKFGSSKRKKVTIRQAKEILLEAELKKMLDSGAVISAAIKRAEESGVVFLDEIDKICSSNENSTTDISRRGVQRDLLSILSGTIVNTKHGPVSTDHILFIASGAFHSAKVSDLLPELQGRLHIKVRVNPLSESDFVKILTQTKHNLVLQYKELMSVDGVDLHFTDDAINEIARCAFYMNESIENIGARRLKSVMEKVLQDVSFESFCLERKKIVIDSEYVNTRLKNDMHVPDFKNYIL